MKFSRSMFLLAAVLGALFALEAPAHADPIDLELALVIDGSGSITAAEFLAQKNAYVAALNNVLPANGSVAVGVWQFSTSVQSVFTTQVISNAADLASLVSAIGGMTQLNSFTAIGDAINTAAAALLGNAIDSNRQVIDVSTDGASNRGANPDTAATTQVGNGIDQINGLGIGLASTPGWVQGTDSFFVANVTFAGIQAALETKLERELGVVPEPSTLALLGLSLFGVALHRRRRNMKAS